MKRPSVMWCKVVCALVVLSTALTFQHERRGPNFIQEPPRKLDFSNSTGAVLSCSAIGYPEPRIQWILDNGTPVNDIPGIRYSRPNGSLVFPPFRAEDYRQDVHAAIYRCTASNTIGTVVSTDASVRAVVKQRYSVDVYDKYVMEKNTAVMECHVPGFVKDYVQVVSWMEEPTNTVIDPGSHMGAKYQVLSTGELYIRDVEKNFQFRSYRCQVRDLLTGEDIRSSTAGRIIVSDSHNSVRPTISHSRTRIVAWSGDNVFLPCAAEGLPPPSCKWRREDAPMGTTVFHDPRTSQTEGILMIRRVTIQDTGKYVCEANNSVGSSKAFTDLVVMDQISVRISPSRQQVHVGQTVTIKCIISGHPIGVVRWRHNTHPLITSERITLAAVDTVFISSVQKEDKGMYQCLVHNEMGSVQASYELSLAEDLPEFRDTFSGDTVSAGQRFSLKCSASGNPLPQITWTLDSFPVPETHRVRLGDYVTQHGVVISYLNFSTIQVEDGGEYRCTANNGVGSIHHSARINIPGPPVVRSMKNRTVVAGETLVIKCPVAGYPLESINWERGGVRLPYNHRQKVHDNGSLEVHHVERATDEGPYTCVAKNNEGQTAQNTVFITIKVKPSIDPFDFPTTLREGQRSSILCTVSSGDLPINVTWYKDGQPIVPSNPATVGISVHTVEGYSSTLSFRSLKLDYRGNYTCIAANDAGTVNHTTFMVIHVPPQWIIEPVDVSVVKGRNTIIDCEADGFPQPRVRWTKSEGDSPRDFKPVVSSPHLQVFENGSLAINDAKEEDSGFFLCQATNGIGQGLSKVITVTVHIAAHFKSKFTAEMIRKGQNAKLKCDATGDKPISVSWMKDKQIVNPEGDPRYVLIENIYPTGITSEIEIKHTDRRDSALFTCIAKNNFGQDDTNIQLIVQEPPDAPQELKMVESSSRSVKLEWTAPYTGNLPITGYTIQFKDDNAKWHSKTANVSTMGPETSGTVRGLKPAITYHFRVIAENRFGKSEPSHSIKVTTHEEAPGGPPGKVRASPISSHAIKVTWKPPTKDVHYGAISGYYVGYRVAGSSNSYIYKTLNALPPFKEECELTALDRYTQYSIIVQAYNSKGAGPPSDEIIVQTLDSDPPAAPLLKIAGQSFSSVDLQWDLRPDDGNPITGFYVRQKESTSYNWTEKHLLGDRTTYVASDLRCGGTYQFAILGYNSAGRGPLSNTLTVKTNGGAPVAPDRQSVLKYNTTYASVNLSAWHSGGCPIRYFAVKYKKQQDREWTLLHSKYRERFMEIRNLTPSTMYSLQVTAHNSAGVTEAEYAFTTLSVPGNSNGAGPEVHQKTSSGVSDVTIILPVVVSILVVIVVLVVVCLVVRKKHSSGSSQSGSSLYGTRKSGMQESMQMADLEKSSKSGTGGTFFPAPYATTHLGTRGPEKRTDLQEEPLYATVKRTPRPPRSDGHIYQCPALARNGRPARIT